MRKLPSYLLRLVSCPNKIKKLRRVGEDRGKKNSGGTHGELDFNKAIHFQNTQTNFFYKYLLEKPVTDGLLK